MCWNVPLYFYGQKEQQQRIQRLINAPLFQPFINYFLAHSQDDVTLRKLKQAFPDEKKLEFFIDQMIQVDLLERKQRRYRLVFPFFSKETVLPEILQASMEEERLSLSFMMSLAPALKLYLLGEWLWPLLFENEQAYFFIVDQAIYSSLFLKTEALSNEWSLVSIHPAVTTAPDLAIYFDCLARGQALPKNYQSLEALLGDVSVDYFMGQLTKVKRTLKRTTTKRNIFKEALQLTQDIQKDEQKQPILATVMIEQEQYHVLPAACQVAEEKIK